MFELVRRVEPLFLFLQRARATKYALKDISRSNPESHIAHNSRQVSMIHINLESEALYSPAPSRPQLLFEHLDCSESAKKDSSLVTPALSASLRLLFPLTPPPLLSLFICIVPVIFSPASFRSPHSPALTPPHPSAYLVFSLQSCSCAN